MPDQQETRTDSIDARSVGRQRYSPSRWVIATALLVLAGGIVALLYPVLASPVGADDRYWYLDVPGQTGGSYVEATTWTFGDVLSDARSGRVAPLAFLLRRFIALTVTNTAVATSTPIVAVQAVMKLVLLSLVVFTCMAFLRSLRWRSSQGSLVTLSRRTILVTTVTTAVILAIGAQAHDQFRNGWTSYTPLTYTAVIVILGSLSLILSLTRRAASGKIGWKVTSVGLAAVIGLALNISYELFYVAAPLVVLTLLLQPIHVDARIGRRAKVIVGGTFVSVFTAIFVALRVWLTNLCSSGDCYPSAQADLNGAVVTTFLRNLATAVPGGARNELRADLARLGWEDKMPGLFAPIPLLISGVVAAGLLFAWWLFVGPGKRSGGAEADQDETRRESSLLVAAAIVPFAAALGTALVMALSSSSHEFIVSVGSTYRNTMATWALLALTGAMLVRAATLRWTARQSTALLVGVAVAVTAVGGHVLTANLAALRANRAYPSNVVTEAIQWEVVLGDPSDTGDKRRCALLEALAPFTSAGTRSKIAMGADASFELYHGTRLCSTGIPDLS